MKNYLKPKWISLYFILLVDILVLPSLILLPEYVVKYQFEAASHWFKDFSVISSITQIIHNSFLLKIWLYLQFIFFALVILIFWKDTPGKKNKMQDIGGPEAAGSGQFGTSRWQSEKEIAKTTATWKFHEMVLAGGIVLGALLDRGKQFAYIDKDDANTIIIGATRSGKTRRLIFPTIWMLAHAGESMIITDPKGELYDRTSTSLRKRGYNVRFIDFRKPGRGNRINYMEPVLKALREKNVPEATKHAWTIAHMFVYQKPGSDKGESIWRDGAESVIAALILAVAMEAPSEKEKHMYSVYKMLVELGRVQKVRVGNQIIDYVPLNDYMERLPLDHPARDAYATAFLAPERTRGSFFSSVSAHLRLFADPSVAYLTSYQDHELIGAGREKTAVFLIIPDEDTTRHPYAALYVNQTYDALVEYANECGGRLPIRVNMLLDEFGNMPPFPDFDTKLTVSLGRGVRWNMVIQAYGQLTQKYGEHVADTIKGNAQNTIYLRTNDNKTAEDLSKRTGMYTIATEGSSYNVGQHHVNRGGSSSFTGRRLLTPDEILKWPRDMSLVLRGGMNPTRLPLPDLSLWPADQEFKSIEDDEKRVIHKVDMFIPNLNQSSSYSSDELEVQEETAASSDTDMFMDVD
ncbi:type IV secretory system conjugative DNA transfer family protein [Paenibacillus alvei]|uniref:Type IV secretory system conjugative DNA transfer family protein n=1 Tax=Paenibacillus alvei TaxID=44250 RepID=A0ABT4H2L5_PAEAL|nr:type IV secretory system conjugative DNA transfer family protein [Paenibacillus alvei]MCY9763215.1 type IV secretory system conjugative DNA transfer family protein [Paenibacillus alvei]MCY9769496.1 type IV secretory system conjugative DNA transfer family protein [Paenibacillus alvei]